MERFRPRSLEKQTIFPSSSPFNRGLICKMLPTSAAAPDTRPEARRYFKSSTVKI